MGAERKSRKDADVSGFILLCSGFVGLLTYYCWIFIPNAVLHETLSITYYPSKYWGLALPLFVCFTLLMAPTIYTFYNMSKVPDWEDMRSAADHHGKQYRDDAKMRLFDMQNDTPIITDMAPEEACHLIYGPVKQ